MVVEDLSRRYEHIELNKDLPVKECLSLENPTVDW